MTTAIPEIFDADPLGLIPDEWTDLSRIPVAFETLEDLVDEGRLEKRLFPVLGCNGRVRFHSHQYRRIE